MAGEKIFENKVRRYIESLGVYIVGTPRSNMSVEPVGYYEKRWGGGWMTKSGLPDLHICIHGKSIDVELKSETGRVSAMQKLMIDQINDAGGKALVLRPAGFAEFKKLIETYL
jgi:hypothetical protein